MTGYEMAMTGIEPVGEHYKMMPKRTVDGAYDHSTNTVRRWSEWACSEGGLDVRRSWEWIELGD
ncbi:MAG: hypothetical protein HY513_00610 [Candidatus Aenigmarchaeota archaeon]|nr:hypothetical protein [Candidatus Aenigmarchaeota archaeon]